MIIAIDGPAGSGKSTVAKALAKRLGTHYLDTGAMYRAVAYRALSEGVRLADEAALTALAESMDLRFEHAAGSPVPTAVFADGEDVTQAIRTPDVDAAVSAAARVPGVRAAMVPRQREIAAGAAVVEGRDIGTVVFPDAEVKVFLTASPEERARRRHVEQAEAGHEVTHEEVLERMQHRDVADQSREASPAVTESTLPPDALLLDTTGLTIDQVVERIVELAEERR